MGAQPDFGRTAGDYGRHRAGFPEAFFERLAAFGIGRPGQRLLDLGTGTGTIARGFAVRGCEATGLDRSAGMVGEAERLDREAGVAVRYLVAPAEQTGLQGESFEVVTAGQCWHWFDRPRVAAEVRRLLVPGGQLVIGHFDWIPLPGNVVDATERLIERHNPAWRLGGGTGIYPAWPGDVAGAGFEGIETFSVDMRVRYSHEGWRGRIRASAGVGASLAPEAVAAFDRDLAGLLARDFPEDPLAVPHRLWALVCRAPVEGRRRD